MIFVVVTEWASLVPFVGAVSLIVYMSVQTFKPKPPPQKFPVNLKIQKEAPKVVNMVDIEDLGDKVTYCRCWRSKKVSPYITDQSNPQITNQSKHTLSKPIKTYITFKYQSKPDLTTESKPTHHQSIKAPRQ